MVATGVNEYNPQTGNEEETTNRGLNNIQGRIHALNATSRTVDSARTTKPHSNDTTAVARPCPSTWLTLEQRPVQCASHTQTTPTLLLS